MKKLIILLTILISIVFSNVTFADIIIPGQNCHDYDKTCYNKCLESGKFNKTWYEKNNKRGMCIESCCIKETKYCTNELCTCMLKGESWAICRYESECEWDCTNGESISSSFGRFIPIIKYIFKYYGKYFLFFILISIYVYKKYGTKRIMFLYKILYFILSIVFILYLIVNDVYDKYKMLIIVLTFLSIVKYGFIYLLKNIKFFNIINVNFKKLIGLLFSTSIIFPLLFFQLAKFGFMEMNLISIFLYCVFILLLECFLLAKTLKIRFQKSLIISGIINIVFITLFILIVYILRYFSS